MRVPSNSASRTSWVTSRAVLLSLSRRSRNCCCSSTRVTGSSAPKGSSNKQQRRICCERAGDTHPLTLAAGQLAGIARRGELRRKKPDLCQEMLDAGIDVAGLPTLQTGNQSDIGSYSEKCGKRARILDHVPDPTPPAGSDPRRSWVYPRSRHHRRLAGAKAIHHFQGR